MKYRFTAMGHKNILANHNKTLEFTKDTKLSVDGDCIVGVNADFDTRKLQALVKNHSHLIMTIRTGNLSEKIEFVANKDFSSSREVVLRFSEFSSDRTLGFRASKTSALLNRKLVGRLRDPRQRIIVEIEPMIKLIIFDFDNTLCDLKSALEYSHKKMSQVLCETYGVYGPTAVKLMWEIDAKYSKKGYHSSPKNYDRHIWFGELFRRVGVKATKDDVEKMVRLYWQFTHQVVKPLPGARSVLEKLRQNYKIAVMTDSDGDRKIKMERLRKTGLLRMFDYVVISDDVGVNKPDKEFYSRILKKFNVSADQCVMVGDKPQVDLELGKKMGMTTVWMKYGAWAELHADELFAYVNHEITDLKQLLEVVSQQ
ncbi:HAD-IA family hydrolase [Nanoarchaeota archaeon]